MSVKTESATPSAVHPARPPAGGHGGPIQMSSLHGMSFDEQVATVTPRNAPVQRKAATGAVQRTAAAVQMTAVSNHIADGPYGWTSAYDVSFNEATHECNIAVRVKITPENATVTPENIATIQGLAQSQFQRIWDNKFTITDRTTTTAYRLRLSLAFVDSDAHVNVTLHPGQGRDDLSNWYVQQIDDVTLAHELGHQLGLKDEYVDSAAPDRATATSPGTHTDHSVMGDYYSEGEAAAGAQLRHGQTIAGHIGGATGRTFDTAQ